MLSTLVLSHIQNVTCYETKIINPISGEKKKKKAYLQGLSEWSVPKQNVLYYIKKILFAE